VHAVVRLALVLKLASLLQGFSGASVELTRFLERLCNAGLLPCVPAQGSVGASGDLAPLAHLSLALLGLGDIRRHGEVLPAAEALAQEGLAPLTLGPKEGLAMLNGTQISTELALAGLFELERVYAGAVVSGALSLDALQGSDAPVDPRVHHLRGHDGQARVAQVYRELLAGSEIRESHRDCARVQDPYSLRCQPQVMGACLDLMTQQAATLTTEANAVTDNPLVFPDSGEVISGGNFHAEPVAFAADILALACAEIGSITERREGRDKLSNTCVVFDPEGEIAAVYRKIHLFDVEVGGITYRESEAEEAGDEPVVARTGEWGLGLSICYDVRFPELYRVLALEGAELLTVPAHFTFHTGRDHWEVLLRARAIENQCFVVAANQVGSHGGGYRSGGRSMIIDPWGLVLATAPDSEAVLVAKLDFEALHAIRRRFPTLTHLRHDVYGSAPEVAGARS